MIHHMVVHTSGRDCHLLHLEVLSSLALNQILPLMCVNVLKELFQYYANDDS